jgi:hypothetical protein
MLTASTITATRTSETSVYDETTRRYIPEDCYLHVMRIFATMHHSYIGHRQFPHKLLMYLMVCELELLLSSVVGLHVDFVLIPIFNVWD